MIFGFLYVLVQQGFNGRKWKSRNVIYDKTEARTPKKIHQVHFSNRLRFPEQSHFP